MKLFVRLTLVALGFFAFGCAPTSYVVKPPAPSNMKVAVTANQATTQLAFADERRGEDTIFSKGTLPATLKVDNGLLDPITFLANHTVTELKSRGIAVANSIADNALPKVHVRSFNIQNYRMNGFTPFFTLTFISADLETAAGKKRIGVFLRRGKVPVWSFDEVVEPTFNQPLSIGVKEFASKVANALYGYKASDATTKDLAAKLATRTPDSFMDVYALGFTNNPQAVTTMVGLAKDPDEFVRMAAISSLGNLGAVAQFPLLKSIYESNDTSWQDRAVALKSIADLDTAESGEFINTELKKLSTESKKESQWLAQIIALYL